MSDPISNNQNRLSSAAAANRTTLEKLDRKTPPAKADNAQQTNAPARTQVSDSVNLSNVKERIDAKPDFDRAKVDSIKAALQQGNYPVNPRRIAENFVSLEKLIQG